MEGVYEVIFHGQAIGKVQVIRQGLYYRFCCRCQLPTDGLCRLQIVCGECTENLGILVPMAAGFGLETRLPVKKFPDRQPFFSISGGETGKKELFYPIFAEEPFAYITRIKQGFLERRNGVMGLCVER